MNKSTARSISRLATDGALLKKSLESSFEVFAQYFFEKRNKATFNCMPFHRVMFDALQKVYDGKITRLIINIPPRHGKTELLILFVVYIYARNKRANNLYLSYSDKLSTRASGVIQQYIMMESFQALWPITLASEKKGWTHWMIENGGEVLGAPTGGQITGFGAGITGRKGGSGGVLIIDDPNKPDQMKYEAYRNTITSSFIDTMKNRRNSTNTPMVVIMQRLHEEDLTGFLLDGGDGNIWHHLKIPVYDKHGKVIFPEKYSQRDAESDEARLPEYFSGQYLQEPNPTEGGIWKRDWFEIVTKDEAPLSGIRFDMYVDGAYTKDTHNDPTGIMIAGKHKVTKNLYILHNESKRMEMPELLKRIKTLKDVYDVNMVLAEPKASGKTIVQLLRELHVNSACIDTKWNASSKVDKANDCAPYIEGGRVFLVRGNWNDAYLNEVAVFPKGKHDEAVDNTAYAIERTMMKQDITIYLDKKSDDEQENVRTLKFVG